MRAKNDTRPILFAAMAIISFSTLGFITGCANSLSSISTAKIPTESTPSKNETSTRTAALVPRQVSSRSGTPNADNSKPYYEVPIYWGTNRDGTPRPPNQVKANIVLTSFNSQPNPSLALGLSVVTVPKTRKTFGTIPRPLEINLVGYTLYEAKEDRSRHFTIGRTLTMGRVPFLRIVRSELRNSHNFSNQCLVYVHGYRNTFEDAVFRAAQIKVDMAFDGAFFVFSWPSGGTLASYIHDKDAVDASSHAFFKFITILNDKSSCEKVHIIAHSMGSSLLVETFYPAIGDSPLRKLKKLGQIVLAAPDVSSAVLRSRAKEIGMRAIPITLYANGRDGALKFSQAAAGFQRAGDVTDAGPLIMDGIDSIDLTPMSSAMWVFVGGNHNEYAERPHVLKDIALLIKSGTRPPDRRFPVYREVKSQDGLFWRYVMN